MIDDGITADLAIAAQLDELRLAEQAARQRVGYLRRLLRHSEGATPRAMIEARLTTVAETQAHLHARGVATNAAVRASQAGR